MPGARFPELASIRVLLWVPVLAAMAAYPARAAEETQCRFARIGVLPIATEASSIIVEGAIDGQPIRMEIDTGASSTSLFQHAADRLGLPMRHLDERVFGVGGDSTQYLATVKTLELGPLKAKSVRLPVIREYADGISRDGLVGSDFLLHQDIEISPRDGKITLFRPVKCQDTFLAYWDDNAFIADLEAPGGDQRQFPILNVELNGKKARAIIDTGAAVSIVSLAAAARAGITPESPNVVGYGRMGGVGVAKTETWVATFDSFSIGDELVQHPRILIGDLWSGIRDNVKKHYVNELVDEMPEMLLGMDFIRAHRLLFAVSQRRLYFSYLGGPVFHTDPPREPDGENPSGKGS